MNTALKLSDHKVRPAPTAAKLMFVNELSDKSKASHCTIHGNYYPLIGAPAICPECAIVKTELAEAEHRTEMFKSRELRRHIAAGIPARHSNCGFKNFDQILPGQSNAVNACLGYAKQIKSGQSGCLVMTGPTGTGKTHLSVSIIRNVMARTSTKEPLFARYATSADIANDLLSAWIRERNREGDNEKASLQRYVTPDLLVIDEIGLDDYREAQFADIWESINGADSWVANPWVWIVEFKRVGAQ